MTTLPATRLQSLLELDLALSLFQEAATHDRRRKLLAPIVRKLERGLQAAFRAQGRIFLQGFSGLKSHFSESVSERDWSSLFTEAELKTLAAFEGPLDRAAAAALSQGGRELIASLNLGISFDLKNPRAVTYLDKYGARRVAQINETTRDYLRTVITKGVDEGWSYDRMAKAITDRYKEFAVGRPQLHIDSRAHMIAVTEVGNAYEEGNLIVARGLKDAGLVMEKGWLTVGDNRVSEECLENEAAGFIPLDQPFPGGVDRPLQHPGCRCTALYRRAAAREAVRALGGRILKKGRAPKVQPGFVY